MSAREKKSMQREREGDFAGPEFPSRQEKIGKQGKDRENWSSGGNTF